MKTWLKHIKKPVFTVQNSAFQCSQNIADTVAAASKLCWPPTVPDPRHRAQSKRTSVCVFATFIISAFSTWLILTYSDLIAMHLPMPQRRWVWLFIVVNKHVALNKRMRTVGNMKTLLSKSVTHEHQLRSTQEICWCSGLAKSVQYASLNHKVTISWHSIAVVLSPFKYALLQVVCGSALIVCSHSKNQVLNKNAKTHFYSCVARGHTVAFEWLFPPPALPSCRLPFKAI